MAFFHAHNATHAAGKLDIVRGNERTEPLLPDQPEKFFMYLLGGAGIEIPRRLIGQQQ